jgi:cardiolipin synthase (CMP-forming)
MLTLPNFLTMLRIALVPVFLISITGDRFGAALCIFMFAGITDAFDGALARLQNTQSELGASIDPLADKLLMASSFIVLGWIGGVPVWLTILVLSRDVVILLGYLSIYFFTQPIEVKPTAIGKANTFFQIFTVGFALLTLARPDMPMFWVNTVTQWVTGATTAASGLHYVYVGLLWQQTHPKE